MDILARTSSELRSAFAEANDGDVIKLAPGDYSSVRLRNKDFDTDVTITSADSGNRAVFDEYLELNDVSGVTIKGVDVEARSLAPDNSFSRLQVVKSQDVTLRDISVEGHIPSAGEGANPSSAGRTEAISGYGYENGVRVRWSDGIILDDVEFSKLGQALAVIKSDNTKISDIDVHDVREGINLNDVDNTLIEGSLFHDFKPFYRSDHPDMIQFWGTDSGVHGLTVQNNLLDQSDGWTQSIFGHFNGRPDDVTGSDFSITGNTIINGHWNAIRIREIDGFEISDNILLPNNSNFGERKPYITVLESQNGEVSGNILLPRWDGSLINLDETALNTANIAMTGNVALSTESNSDLFWKNFLKGEMPNILPSADEDSSSEDEPVSDETPQANSGTEEEPSIGDEAVVDSDDSLVEQPKEGGRAAASEDGSEVAEPLAEETVAEEPSGEGDHESGHVPNPDTISPAVDVSQVDLAGTANRDWLRDTAGSTSLAGEEKDDVFVFDYRADTAEAHDVIADFDFSEGDRLVLTSSRAGTFDDDVDPGNNLLVLHGGTRTHIQSANDLREAAAGGGISLETSHGGNLVLTFDDAPDRSIELLGISPDEFSI